MKYILLFLFFCISNLSFAVTQDEVEKYIYGNWCSNTEEYDGDVSIDGTKWTFNKDGSYVYITNYKSVDKYTIKAELSPRIFLVTR